MHITSCPSQSCPKYKKTKQNSVFTAYHVSFRRARMMIMFCLNCLVFNIYPLCFFHFFPHNNLLPLLQLLPTENLFHGSYNREQIGTVKKCSMLKAMSTRSHKYCLMFKYFMFLKEKELETLAAMDMELQKIAAKLHDNST